MSLQDSNEGLSIICCKVSCIYGMIGNGFFMNVNMTMKHYGFIWNWIVAKRKKEDICFQLIGLASNLNICEMSSS